MGAFARFSRFLGFHHRVHRDHRDKHGGWYGWGSYRFPKPSAMVRRRQSRRAPHARKKSSDPDRNPFIPVSVASVVRLRIAPVAVESRENRG